MIAPGFAYVAIGFVATLFGTAWRALTLAVGSRLRIAFRCRPKHSAGFWVGTGVGYECFGLTGVGGSWFCGSCCASLWPKHLDAYRVGRGIGRKMLRPYGMGVILRFSLRFVAGRSIRMGYRAGRGSGHECFGLTGVGGTWRRELLG